MKSETGQSTGRRQWRSDRSCSQYFTWTKTPSSHRLAQLGPPVVPFYPFLGEASPTKIDYRKKGTCSNFSTGGPNPKWTTFRKAQRTFATCFYRLPPRPKSSGPVPFLFWWVAHYSWSFLKRVRFFSEGSLGNPEFVRSTGLPFTGWLTSRDVNHNLQNREKRTKAVLGCWPERFHCRVWNQSFLKPRSCHPAVSEEYGNAPVTNHKSTLENAVVGLIPSYSHMFALRTCKFVLALLAVRPQLSWSKAGS